MDYSIVPNNIDRSLRKREDRLKWRHEKSVEMANWMSRKRAEYYGQGRVPDVPTITEVFRDESVFITGATGVLGKILVEKLLYSCSHIKHLYLLVRPLKGMTGRERMDKQFSKDIYDRIRQKDPAAFDKVRIVHGDCNQVGLGLSPEDRAELCREVGIVFHGAASVRFDDPLRKATLLNVRGTREVVELAKDMTRLKAFVHISTVYCNTKEGVVLEEVYDTPMDWRVVVKAAEDCETQQFETMTQKIIGYQPNTYTFTKQLAEAVVEEAKHEIPIIIARPSVVVSCAHEPIVGWTDNLYGPGGICVGVMKGVLRFQYGDRYIVLDYIPADTAIRTLIVCAWIRATNQKLHPDPDKTDVVNLTISDVLCIQYYDVELLRDPTARLAPFNDALRYPRYTLTRCKPYYYLGLFFSHILFAVLADSVLRLTGNKPRVMGVYRQVFYANHSLLYFMLNNFSAQSDNQRRMLVWMRPEDLDDFDLVWDYEEDDVLVGSAKSIEEHKFNATYDKEKNKAHYARLFVLEVVSWILFGILVLWCAMSFDVHGKLSRWLAQRLSSLSL